MQYWFHAVLFALLDKPRTLFSAVATVHSIAFSTVTKFSCDTRCRSYSSTCTAIYLPPRSITSCSRAEKVSALSGPLTAHSAEGEALEGPSLTLVPVLTGCAFDGCVAGEELARAGRVDVAQWVLCLACGDGDQCSVLEPVYTCALTLPASMVNPSRFCTAAVSCASSRDYSCGARGNVLRRVALHAYRF